VESVVVVEYRWKGGNGGEIINDIQRGGNLYKRPRFQRERDIQVVTSNGMIGPGEVTSPAHSVLGSFLQALAVTSSCHCLLCWGRSGEQGEADLERSAQPDAIAQSPSTQALTENADRHQTNTSTFPSVLHPGAHTQNEGVNATRNWWRAVGSNKTGKRAIEYTDRVWSGSRCRWGWKRELIVRLGRRWARVFPWRVLVPDRSEVVPRMLGGSIVRGGRKRPLVQSVVPGRFGTAEGYFLVESAEPLHFHLCLSETCLHLLSRLLEVHDVISSSFQERNLAALLVGDWQDVLQPGISVAEFVSTTLFRLDTLPSGGFLPGVGKMFSEGDTHHWIFFVRDRATAATTTRGASGGRSRIISYRASVGKAVTAAR